MQYHNDSDTAPYWRRFLSNNLWPVHRYQPRLYITLTSYVIAFHLSYSFGFIRDIVLATHSLSHHVKYCISTASSMP